MDKATILLENGISKAVNCIFYLFNSKYYFLYTENEIDQNGYVKLYLVQVGKETQNTPNGIIETGNMIGVEIPTNDEWKLVQESISKIVDSKKTGVNNEEIQYLPISMLVNLRIISKKTFRLLKDIVEKDFNVVLNPEEKAEEQITASETQEAPVTNDLVTTPGVIDIENPQEVTQSNDDVVDTSTVNDVESTPVEEVPTESNVEEQTEEENPDIILDYRTRFFEEQEKTKRLQEQIDELNKKINDIYEIIKDNLQS